MPLLAPAARGIIIASSLLVAASIYVYENEHVRAWFENILKESKEAWADFFDNFDNNEENSNRRKSAWAHGAGQWEGAEGQGSGADVLVTRESVRRRQSTSKPKTSAETTELTETRAKEADKSRDVQDNSTGLPLTAANLGQLNASRPLVEDLGPPEQTQSANAISKHGAVLIPSESDLQGFALTYPTSSSNNYHDAGADLASEQSYEPDLSQRIANLEGSLASLSIIEGSTTSLSESFSLGEREGDEASDAGTETAEQVVPNGNLSGAANEHELETDEPVLVDERSVADSSVGQTHEEEGQEHDEHQNASVYDSISDVGTNADVVSVVSEASVAPSDWSMVEDN